MYCVCGINVCFRGGTSLAQHIRGLPSIAVTVAYPQYVSCVTAAVMSLAQSTSISEKPVCDVHAILSFCTGSNFRQELTMSVPAPSQITTISCFNICNLRSAGLEGSHGA